MLIGDEVHGLGAPNLKRAMVESAGLRLGLSATPRRWYDEEGTDAIFSYFGQVCFQFSLDEAIGEFLTPYEYFPQLVSLTDEECDLYNDLTQKILGLSVLAKEDTKVKERVKRLLIQRAHIVATAKAKLPAAVSLIESLIKTYEKSGHKVEGLLIYCAPGQHKEVLKAIARTGLRCHEFVHTVSLSQRAMVLSEFASGQIQALVAIRCLDEGVDVPSTRMAIILASSSNPREFIQRRGRILRKAPGKERAVIHDFLVVPPAERDSDSNSADVSVLRKEMPRFVEFSASATNTFSARQKVRGLLDRFGLLHLLDEKPWDVYHKLKRWDGGENE